MRRWAGVWVAAGLVVAGVAACGDDDAAGDKKAFCDRVRDIALTAPEVFQGQGSGTQLRRLQADAPESIADDLQTLSDATSADSATSEAEVEAALDNVAAYITDQCGIEVVRDS